MTLIDRIQLLVQEAISCKFPEFHTYLKENNRCDITVTKDPAHGDYQCNEAMKLAKKKSCPPREIALAIAAQLDKSPLFKSVTVAGPGFINMTLADTILIEQAHAMLNSSRLGVPSRQHEKLIIDFSSPNVAKEMHVGHLRSTIIGDSLARIFEFLEYDVLRLNHIGDWGTAFGMLICHIQSVAPDALTGKEPVDLPRLMQWYKESKKRFDEDPDFMKAAQLKVVALQQGDPSALQAWKLICDISEKAYHAIYQLLDIQIQTRGESFYNPLLKSTVQDLTSRGIATLSDGAQCIFIEGYPAPLIIQKSDGGFGYASTDMAAIWHRTQVEHAKRIVYVTDAGQGSHFAMIFEAARKAGYVTPDIRVEHVPFGLVLGPDGKKFKTRSGETEKLIDLLLTAIQHARAILESRETPPEEIDRMAQILGINAIKYADLSCHRQHDYAFSYERMLKFEGNTAAYIMYSLVRILSIQRKLKGTSGIETGTLGIDAGTSHTLEIHHPSERALLLQINRFGECIQQVAEELLPHRLTEYLYQLANLFNAFFRDCRVEGSEEEASRRILLELTEKVFRTGMHLLGLKPLERM